MVKKLVILSKYSDYINIFLKNSTVELLKHSNISKHFINPELGKEPPYKPIHSLKPVELKTVKTYIKANLANGLIWLSKYFAKILILFVWKPDGSFCLYINYLGLNNLTMKNSYSLPLIRELLN